jgi:ceramide glucosyltransferase
VAGLVLQVVFLVCVRRVRARQAVPTSFRPAVSVLRPVRGVDEEFVANLLSLCKQSYPVFEIIVITDDPDDAALLAVRQVKAQYPDVPMRVVIGDPPLGRNPKVSNLIHGARVARYEWLLISDSNVRTHRDYLARLLDEAAAPGVGMVGNLIVGGGAKTLGARLDNEQLNGYLLCATAMADVARDVPCVMGKSMLFRRADLEAVGGFASVANHLAEDFLLARAFHRSGRRVVISADSLHTVNRTSSIRDFVSRQLRWNQIRWKVAPRAYWAEGLATPTVPLMALGAIGAWERDSTWVALALLLLAGRVMLQAVLAKSAQPNVALGWERVWLVPLRDLFAVGIWLAAPFRSTVTWRGRRYRLGSDTVIDSRPQPATGSEVPQPEIA